MTLIYSAKPSLDDSLFKVGKQLPKTVKSHSMEWKWMGNYIPLNKLAWGQLRQIKKVCLQHKGTWYGYPYHVWVSEIDKILKPEELKSIYIKVIGFTTVLADQQSNSEKMYKLR